MSEKSGTKHMTNDMSPYWWWIYFLDALKFMECSQRLILLENVRTGIDILLREEDQPEIEGLCYDRVTYAFPELDAPNPTGYVSASGLENLQAGKAAIIQPICDPLYNVPIFSGLTE